MRTDYEMREGIRLAICRAFERNYDKYDESYNPDTTGEAADEVIAYLISKLTGEAFIANFHPTMILASELCERR